MAEVEASPQKEDKRCSSPVTRIHCCHMEPWEVLDHKLNAFGQLVVEQQYFLAEMRELVNAQTGRAEAVISAHYSGTPSHLPVRSSQLQSSKSSLFSASRPIWLSPRSSVDSHRQRFEIPIRQDSPLILPVLNVFHHGNNMASWVPRFVEVPSFRRGFFPWLQGNMARLVNSAIFEPFMACVIGLNALNIGVAIDLELRGQNTDFNNAAESVFLVIFSLELLLRVGGRGFRSLLTWSSALDSFVIFITLLTMLVKPTLSSDGEEQAQVSRVLDQMMILRMARLLRLTRLIACMESLWKLAQGLVRCVGTMGSACVLMFITIYIFACFGAELIAKPYLQDEEVGKLLREHFSTMPKIVLTLFRFVSMDSTAQIYAPLVEHSPALALYFWLLLMIVPIALLNLITAILVEDVISTVQADAEMKQIQRRRQLKHLTPALKELFVRLDTSKDGHVQIKEVAEAVRDGLEIPEALQAFLNPARMLDLFDALDADNSGDLSEEEFVDGLTYASMSDVPIETIQILHLLRSLKQEVGRGGQSRKTTRTLQEVVVPTWTDQENGVECAEFDSEGALAI